MEFLKGLQRRESSLDFNALYIAGVISRNPNLPDSAKKILDSAADHILRAKALLESVRIDHL